MSSLTIEQAACGAIICNEENHEQNNSLRTIYVWTGEFNQRTGYPCRSSWATGSIWAVRAIGSIWAIGPIWSEWIGPE